MSAVLARSCVGAIASAIAAAVCTSACSGPPAPQTDGGSERDAALVEGGQPDAAAFDGAGAFSDAAARDSGSLPACAMGDCDPRVFACGDGGGTCALRDRTPMCVMNAGPLHRGDACATETECGPGLACFRDGARGICAEICCPGADTCAIGNEVCSADGVLVTGISTSWGRCAPPRACDVLAPDCAPREGCYIVYPDPGDPQCLLAGTADAGEDCVAPDDCLSGLYCAGIGTPKTCVRVCRVGVTSSCPAGEGDCVAQAYSPAGSGVCVASAGFLP